MKKLTAAFAAFVAIAIIAPQARAAELTLNDLPKVLDTLRDCGKPPTCELETLFAVVRPDGTITFHYKQNGVAVYGQGATVGAAVRSLAVKLNQAGNQSKEAVRRIAPLLESQ